MIANTLKALILATVVALTPSQPAQAFNNDQFVWTSPGRHGSNVHLYVYWSLQCPHCHEAMPYLKRLPRKYPWVKVHLREVTKNPQYIDDYIAMAEATGQRAGSVPAFFYCGQMYSGWGDEFTTGGWLTGELQTCHTNPADFD